MTQPDSYTADLGKVKIFDQLAIRRKGERLPDRGILLEDKDVYKRQGLR